MSSLGPDPVRERVVHDEAEPCPYLSGQTARMPLRWQLEPLHPSDFDRCLAQGDRRVGQMLYRTKCPTCTACEPIRIPVDGFEPSRSQRRVWRRNQDIAVDVAPASFSEEKLDLYNRHKLERGLSQSGQPMTRRGYEGWFLRSCTQTVEMRYRQGEHLVGLGIVDLGDRDSSSVYFFFDPNLSDRSLGVYSVMVELAWMRRRRGRFHYLGLYVDGCRHLAYKGSYHPHERRIGGQWACKEKGA